jgi:hypothetical protein
MPGVRFERPYQTDVDVLNKRKGRLRRPIGPVPHVRVERAAHARVNSFAARSDYLMGKVEIEVTGGSSLSIR